MSTGPIEVGTDTLELLVRSREGDQRAFGDLVRRFQPYAFRLAFRLLADEDEARDVAQEAFIRVWRHLERYEPQTRFTTWLYRIVTNLAYDRLRAGRRRRRALEAAVAETRELGTSDSAIRHENQELASRIGALVEELPPRQRVVFALRDLHGLSVAEAAEILNMAEGTVKANLSYARKKIRERLYGARERVVKGSEHTEGAEGPERAIREGAHDAMQEG
jgi:RNA polymerase sigma-70 factor (ECF subfamily)